MKSHEIKIESKYMCYVLDGSKKFELRFNDRDYRVGDSVTLVEILNGEPTGRKKHITICYVLKDVPEYGLKDGYCIFGW